MRREYLIAWIAMIAVSAATSEVKKGTEPADFSNKVAKPNFFRKEKKKMHHKIVRNNKARSSELRGAASCDNGLKNSGKDCSNDEECCSKICIRSKQEEIDGFNKKCVQCETPYDCPTNVICSGAGTTQALCTGDLLPEMPGIDRMTSGYNIFKGTPLIPGRTNDKGWKISKYFIVDVFSPEYDYQDAEPFTHDGTTYLVPSKYTVKNLYANQCTFKSESMETSTSLSVEISKSVDVNGEVPIPYTEGTIGGGVGQASVEKWQQDAQKSKMTSVSKCTSLQFTIQLKLNSKDPYPPLSDEMIYFLENNFDGSTDSYYDLFDSAGTHIILRANLGSMLGVTSSFSSEAMNEIDSACESSTDSLSAGVAGLFSFGTTSSQERCEKAQTAFSNNQEDYEQWSVGSTKTSSQEVWEQDTSSPDILQMGVKSICDVIDKEGFDKATCKSHYKGYCETRLGLTDCVVPDNINCIYDSECDDSGGSEICVHNQCFQVLDRTGCYYEGKIAFYRDTGYDDCVQLCRLEPGCKSLLFTKDDNNPISRGPSYDPYIHSDKIGNCNLFSTPRTVTYASSKSPTSISKVATVTSDYDCTNDSGCDSGEICLRYQCYQASDFDCIDDRGCDSLELCGPDYKCFSIF